MRIRGDFNRVFRRRLARMKRSLPDTLALHIEGMIADGQSLPPPRSYTEVIAAVSQPIFTYCMIEIDPEKPARRRARHGQDSSRLSSQQNFGVRKLSRPAELRAEIIKRLQWHRSAQFHPLWSRWKPTPTCQAVRSPAGTLVLPFHAVLAGLLARCATRSLKRSPWTTTWSRNSRRAASASPSRIAFTMAVCSPNETFIRLRTRSWSLR